MKPWQVWAAFAVCLAVVLLVLAWSSLTVLRLERAEIQAKAQAALEENARLALWRMDSAVTPLLAQESARPYFQYGAYYPAGSTYGRMFEKIDGGQGLVASPLLRESSPQVLLHFQIDPGGRVTSPQVPVGALTTRAVAERDTTTALIAERGARLEQLRRLLLPARLSAVLARNEPPRPAILGTPTPQARATPEPPPQKMKSVKEYEARQQSVQQTNALVVPELERPARAAVEVEESAMQPLWVGEALVLARRVRVGGAVYVQGCWLAWPRLEQELIASVQDLLPAARLERVLRAGPDDERRLAALPVRLAPGSVPEVSSSSSLSPVGLSLLGAWACVLVAALSVAALLRGVLDLSERRRVFVSAVTHELRTPLTTFRLYTDMLAEGMVTGEEKRQEYLGRMRSEAERLGHLVENVLFYSRVESGRAGSVRETVDLAELLEQATGRLGERARSAGLGIVLERPGPALVRASVDRSALEQVLVNLVDNACKYARASDPPLVRVGLQVRDGRALIRVRDHGPGLSRADRRRLFRAFSKSDREAATSAPGVGLGLALSRRLMRAQGGDLVLDGEVTDGAAFVLSLPRAD